MMVEVECKDDGGGAYYSAVKKLSVRLSQKDWKDLGYPPKILVRIEAVTPGETSKG